MLVEQTVTREERTNAALAHAGALLNVFTRGLLGIILALIIYLTQKGKSAYVERQALQALLYQLVGLGVEVAAWVGWGLLFAGSIFVPVLVNPNRPEPMMAFTMIPAFLLVGIPILLGLLWTGLGMYAAYQTWHGRNWSYPVIGKWVQ